jgi:hypothetical protein
MHADIQTSNASNDFTKAEESAVGTNSAAETPEIGRDMRYLYDQFAEMQRSQPPALRSLTAQQATVLADLAFALLQKRRGQVGALATILSGRIDELEPEQFRQTLATLVKCASGSSLDVMGGLFGRSRETDIRKTGQYAETDKSFSSRLSQMILRQPLWGIPDRRVGISLKTTLHFNALTTLVQQEAAIEMAVNTVKDEIIRTQVDERLRINDLWLMVRFNCQDVVIDVGEPNRPFEEVLLWRDGKPEPLIGNYLVQTGERLIIEPSLLAAIDIRPAGGLPTDTTD